MGSSAEKMRTLSGIEDLTELFKKKRIRWAASVYGRCLPSLRDTAQKILDQAYDTHNVQWRWMSDTCSLSERYEVSVQE